MRSTFNSCSSNRARDSFSGAVKETPEVCSPSLKVVSMISIRLRSITSFFFP